MIRKLTMKMRMGMLEGWITRYELHDMHDMNDMSLGGYVSTYIYVLLVSLML